MADEVIIVQPVVPTIIVNPTIPEVTIASQGAQGPVGPQGPSTIAVGTTTTTAPGTNASVTNVGTSANLILDFGVPRGNTGAQGAQGDAATINVGTTTTGAAGTPATVNNSGSTSAAVFNFTIPEGEQGIQGEAGIVAQTTAPVDTDILWLDTDEPAVAPATVSVTAPIVNTGTSTNANIGISAGTTSVAGALQLTDSVASTSTTTAATPNAVKTAYDSAIKSIQPFDYVTNRFYRSPHPNALSSSFSTAVDRTYYMPFYVRKSNTFDRIAIVSGSTFSGPGVVRLGIYNDTNGFPSTVELDAGTVAPAAINTTYTITISETLAVGWYWLACNSQTVGVTNTFYGTNLSGYIAPDLGVTAMINNATQGFSQNVNVSSGFATATSLTSILQNPLVGLRST